MPSVAQEGHRLTYEMLKSASDELNKAFPNSPEVVVVAPRTFRILLAMSKMKPGTNLVRRINRGKKYQILSQVYPVTVLGKPNYLEGYGWVLSVSGVAVVST